MDTLKQAADKKAALDHVAGYFKLDVTKQDGTTRTYWNIPSFDEAELIDAQIGYITKSRIISVQTATN